MLLYIFLIIHIDFITLIRSQKWTRDLSQPEMLRQTFTAAAAARNNFNDHILLTNELVYQISYRTLNFSLTLMHD